MELAGNAAKEGRGGAAGERAAPRKSETITTLERPRGKPKRRNRTECASREFSRWHEDTVENLLPESGLSVSREPRLPGKTPDLLVRPEGAEPFIVECIARLPDPEHAREMEEHGTHVCSGDIAGLHANVYSRLDQKATKYREISRHMPYVVALYDGSCLNSLQTAIDMTMSPYQPTVERDERGIVRGRRYNTLWSGQEEPEALFDRYPHLSGLIYSRWPREHHYLPNPNAERPVSPDRFPFAGVPALPERYRPGAPAPREATLADRQAPPPSPWERQLMNTSDMELHRILTG